MTHTAQEEYMNTLQQENEIESGMRSNEINEEQGQQQLQQIRQERAAIASRKVSYIGGLAPGESRPSQSNPGYNETRGQDGSVTFSRNLTPYQGIPERDREQAWIDANSRTVQLPDGSSVVLIPDPSDPSKSEKIPVKSPEVLAREAEAARQAQMSGRLKTIGSMISSLGDQIKTQEELKEQADIGSVNYIIHTGLIEDMNIKLRDYRNREREQLDMMLSDEPANVAPPAAEVAEGPLPGEPDAQFRGVMEGMPGVGGGAPVGLEGVDGRIVPHNESFAGPPPGQIGSTSVNPGRGDGSQENPVYAPTAMDAVRLPVGTWFSTPDGVVDKVTLRHKQRAGLPIGVDAGAAGGAAVGASGAASVASQPSILDSPAATAFRMLSN